MRLPPSESQIHMYSVDQIWDAPPAFYIQRYVPNSCLGWKRKTGRDWVSRKCLGLQFPQACIVASRLHQLFVGTSLYDFSLVHVHYDVRIFR